MRVQIGAKYNTDVYLIIMDKIKIEFGWFGGLKNDNRYI